MDRLSLLLSFAIVWLSLSYVLFTGQQYFSVLALVLLFLVALSSAVVFVACYRYSVAGSLVSSVKTDRIVVGLLVGITLLALIEAIFDSVAPSFYSSIPVVLALVAGGVAVSIVGIFGIRKLTKNMKPNSWISAVVCIALIAIVAYALMYSIRNVNWNGVDELAYNYYASYLFVHGTNPYLASMQTILQQHSIFPTVQLNGMFEYAYDYPALSFLPYLFLPLFGISNFFAFILITLFLAVFAAYYIYYKSGFNKWVLVPLAVWLFMTFTLVGTVNQYLAVSLLFLIAYVERKRVLLSGILLGLSASIIQLVWFAIPFFYILVYREYGNKHLLKCIGFTVLAFLAVNGYFLVISPKAFVNNVFAVFGTSKLVAYGPNILQLILPHYGLPSWYPAIVSIVTLLSLLALFYLYTNTLKPLIAVAPIMIFFLAWRNISIYGMPFIPIIIAVYYIHDKEPKPVDLLKDRRPILYSFAALAVVFAMLAVLVHGSYVKENLIGINTITPIIYGQQGPVVGGKPTIVGPYSLGGLRINVQNNANYTQPISFYLVSRSPNGSEYLLNSSLNVTLRAHSSNNYTLQYQLPLVSNNTQVYIFAFSQYYTASRLYRLSLKGS
jgi:uncharacterized membrane protein